MKTRKAINEDGEEMIVYETGNGEFNIAGIDSAVRFEMESEEARSKRPISVRAVENLCNKFNNLGSFWSRNYDTLTPVEQMFEQTFRFWCDISGKQDFGLQEQAEVISRGNKYVIDFLFDASDEHNIYLCKDNSVKVAIEIDGHDYHHANKKQVAHDYERENNLKLDGYSIIRFTGSQVYNEPFKCGKIAYDYISDLAEKPKRRKR